MFTKIQLDKIGLRAKWVDMIKTIAPAHGVSVTATQLWTYRGKVTTDYIQMNEHDVFQ